MSTRVEDIIKRVREDILLDQTGDRWDTPLLLRLLTSGLNDFLLKTMCTKSRLYIELETNISLYKLQDYSQKIIRIEYDDIPLTVKTVAEMDIYKRQWLQDIDIKPKFVIFENLPAGTFRIYPKVTSGISSVISQNSLYGGLIDIEVTDDIAQLPHFDEVEQGINKYLTVTYIKKHPSITLASDLEIDSMYDDAMVYYIAGMALRASQDTQNVTLSTQNIGMYESYVSIASQNEAEANHVIPPRTVQYRGFE